MRRVETENAPRSSSGHSADCSGICVCVFVSDPLFVLKQFVNMYMFLFRDVNLQVVEREGGTLILTVGIS